MLERTIAVRIYFLEALAQNVLCPGAWHGNEHRAALHAKALGRDANPRVPLARYFFFNSNIFGIRVHSATNIAPLDQDSAAEVRRIIRSTYQDSGAVECGVIRLERPTTVFGEGSCCPI